MKIFLKIGGILLVVITFIFILFFTKTYYDDDSNYSITLIIFPQLIAMPGSGGENDITAILKNKYGIPISFASFTNGLTGEYQSISKGSFEWEGDCIYFGKVQKLCK